MNTSWTKFGLGVCALAAIAGSASAQKTSNAERGLVGVNLYDSGVKVVSLYGSPDEIQAVTIGGTTQSGGGGGGGFGGPGFGGPGGRGGPSGGPPGGGRADWSIPSAGSFDFANEMLRQELTPQGPSSSSGSGGFSPGRPPGPGGPGFGPGGPPGGGAPASNGPAEVTQYTRWVYNRAGSKYGFIVDNQNRVVQIEAIGLQNNRVKTRKGLGFGATFAQIIKTYGNPDGYEVGGDSILIKYLVNKKVAFRLNRLGAKKPHVVTGIVVSAGKV